METLGQFIRRKRMELGLSQSDLTQRLSPGWPMERSELSKIETDQREMIVLFAERLKILADALEVDPSELLRHARTPPGQR
jgi:transcriptional regulator with XRE-family HTH domain